MAHDSCEGGFEESFDKDAAVLIFIIGSEFDNLIAQDHVMQDKFSYMKDVEMFKDNKVQYKALYYYWCKGIERLLCCQQETAMNHGVEWIYLIRLFFDMYCSSVRTNI